MQFANYLPVSGLYCLTWLLQAQHNIRSWGRAIPNNFNQVECLFGEFFYENIVGLNYFSH